MRVVHVVGGVSEEASGPSYSVIRLCESLIDAGTDARVASLCGAKATAPRPYLDMFPAGLGPRRLGMSPRLGRWLDDAAGSHRCDVIHNHGVWMMPNVYAGRACRRYSNCRLVVSPRGMLSRWALSFHPLRKRLFWHAFQRDALGGAACFHATADNEYEDVRRLGFTQPVCVLPNGIDVPPLVRHRPDDRRRLLFLSRVHPKKGVDILLRAWQAIEDRFPQWDLDIVGPDDQYYLPKMQALAARLLLKRVRFGGPLYGEDKLQAYRAADLFVLPTHSENFGLAVAEALAAGTPAIVTVGAPWAQLVSRHAGWWIDIGVDPLIGCFEEALSRSSEQLLRMGEAGREWMIDDYGWQRIGQQCATTYRWLMDGGETPPWIRLH